MSLVTLIVTLIVVGVLLWAVQAMPWIDSSIKRIIHIIIVVAVALWLASQLFGVHIGNL